MNSAADGIVSRKEMSGPPTKPGKKKSVNGTPRKDED